jgi:hypothetical protein
MKLVFLLLISLLPAYSQLASFGVKAGVPLTDAYQDINEGARLTFSQLNNRYTVGPTAEIHFLFHLSLEADALYRHSNFGVSGGGFAGATPNGIFSVNDWQVPVLGKYQLPGVPMVHPFVDAGPVYHHVSSNNSYPPANPNSPGFAVGGGITFRLLVLRLSPEIRYTHWNQSAFTSGAMSTNNQADFLVGFTF